MTERSASSKSADAYRTISEVAEDLKLPQHVLRFWESRFPQVKPLKRAGGRRFYRPEDVDLLRAVKALLYGDGYTIKGVQRMLREQGPRALATLVSEGAPSRNASLAHPPQGATDQADQDEKESGGMSPPSWLIAPPALHEPPGSPRPGNGLDESRRAAMDVRGAAPPADLAERLRAVLFDLSECERLLATVRSDSA